VDPEHGLTISQTKRLDGLIFKYEGELRRGGGRVEERKNGIRVILDKIHLSTPEKIANLIHAMESAARELAQFLKESS
jgi:hypothetical protein